MPDRRRRDVDDDGTWTEVEGARPDLVESVPIRKGMVLAGRYAVEKIIGRGGSGVVVRANDRDLRQDVAIKIVRAELAGQRMWAARLAREVKLARQIHHPHVCRVFDFEQADGRAFLVMELAENGSARGEIRSGVLVGRPLAARIADARAVASALAAIHAAGIVHRDVTPQNLLRMGDGRLVLSDFGLATDASESTSVHGGTVAYMAPEVLRGGNASFASDIWALGVVMHELVFGVKPRWSGADATEMLAPELGRKLTEEERAVLDACRACTAKEPARRLARAEAAGRLLTERRRWWARPLSARRPFVWAAALTIAAAGVAGVVGTRRKAPDVGTPPSPGEPPLIIPTGEAADWTDISTVLVEVPDRIRCTRLLPDQRTIRFVWGTPPRAEDIDVVTRKRVASPLVAAAYAEGCPDLSPDGKRLVYQGHTRDGRAFAFLSDHPDGADATPAVPTAEPSVSSEPTWLADSDTFSFDVDSKHMGVFSAVDGRMHVLPEPTPRSFFTMFRSVIENQVLVATAIESATDMEVTAIAMPQLKEAMRFRLSDMALDFTPARHSLYYASRAIATEGRVVEVDVSAQRAYRAGLVRDQLIRYPKVVGDGLSFVSIRSTSTLFVRTRTGTLAPLTDDDHVLFAGHCAGDFVVSSHRDGHIWVSLLDAKGKARPAPLPGPADGSAACSPDGRTLYVGRVGRDPSVHRCENGHCRKLVGGGATLPSVSRDGARVLFIGFDKRGPIVKWIGAGGGEVHEISETETGCAPGWAGDRIAWVSRQRAGQFLWTQVDIESGRETGKTVPGTRSCADGRPDPASPVDPDLRIVDDQTSQLRLVALAQSLGTLGKFNETR